MSLTPYTGGNFPIYRFYISTEPSSMCCEVFPLNFNKTSLDDQLEEGQIFYRRKFTGKLLFGTNSTAIDTDGNVQNRQDDWDMFWAYEQADPCTRLYLIITKEIDDEINTYWDGVFSTSDGYFDIDRCTFEVTPLPNDCYNPIFDLADIQHNILAEPLGTPVLTSITTTAYITPGIDIDYTHNKWLAETGVAPLLTTDCLIGYIADQLLTGVQVSSEFFTSDINPVTLHDSLVKYLTIAQKSDIIDPDATDPATEALISWSELMDILWVLFQVTWDYDEDTDTINVEHISWWPVAAGIDLRTQLSCVATNKYTYLKEKMPKYEKFFFMESTGNFTGLPIWYDSSCVNEDPKTNILEHRINVTTDLEHIITNPDSISKDGFVILCNYLDGGSYYVKSCVGEIYDEVRLNMALAWSNLHNAYYRHNRILQTGYMNNALETFISARKTKKQECTAIICDEYDPEETITTELGETYFGGVKAIVEHSELSPDGSIKFALLYGPTDNANPGIEDDINYIRVYQDDDMLYAVLTNAADMEIDITLVLSDCATNPIPNETWTVHLGERTSSYSITHKVPIGLSTTSGDWTISFDYDRDYTCV